jgi:transcriptional regulator with XRE-family HTH domain
MTFDDLRARLIDDLRGRVRCGDATERGLARITGLSQPHIHHLLKGKRLLSIDSADQILRRLEIDIIDLIPPAELRQPRPHR